MDAFLNEMLVTNLTGNTVTIYSRTASGNTAPLRTLSGPSTGLSQPTGVASTGAFTVPTLSEWTRLAMVVSLAGIAVWYLRRLGAALA